MTRGLLIGNLENWERMAEAAVWAEGKSERPELEPSRSFAGREYSA
jgi:hypothetical protein